MELQTSVCSSMVEVWALYSRKVVQHDFAARARLSDGMLQDLISTTHPPFSVVWCIFDACVRQGHSANSAAVQIGSFSAGMSFFSVTRTLHLYLFYCHGNLCQFCAPAYKDSVFHRNQQIIVEVESKNEDALPW